MFRVGQRVVCVNAQPGPEVHPNWRKRLSALREGGIYTVRSIVAVDGGEALRLAEIKLDLHYGKLRERSFYAWRFRPVVDISDLEQIVAEVKRGKPRSIAPDKFDRQRITSAASHSPCTMQRDRAVAPTAPVCRNGECGLSSLKLPAERVV